MFSIKVDRIIIPIPEEKQELSRKRSGWEGKYYWHREQQELRIRIREVVACLGEIKGVIR